MYFVDPPMPGNIHFPGISLYWVIAAPITIGTVLLPAFGGEIFQWLVHTRSNYRIPVIDTILTVLISIFFYTSGDAISIVLQVIFVLLYPVKSAMVTAYAFRQDAKGMASSHKVSSSIDLAVAIMACLAIWISAGPSGSSQAIMWLVLFYFYRLARWSWGRNPVMKQYMSSLWSFSKRKFTQKLNRSGVTIEPG